MGVFQNNLMGAAAAAASASTDFYEHQIANSCRLDGTGYLTDTRSSDGSTNHATISMWFKRSKLGSYQYLLETRVDGNNYVRLTILDDDTIEFQGEVGASMIFELETTQVFRDTSAWYHFVGVLDFDNSTQSDRAQMYINGERVTAFDTATYPSDTSKTMVLNTSDAMRLGASGYDGSYDWNGYLAEVVVIDGTAQAITDMGTSKNGVWIPDDPSSLTFGTNGFYLKFESSSDLGNDSSGNNHDFTLTNISTHDQMLDSPTFNSSSNGGNFPTYNPLLKPPSGLALSEGNLKATLTSDDNGIMTNWQVPLTGKWYWEIDIDNIATDHGIYIGVMPSNTDLTINQESNNLGLVYYSINGNSILKGTRSSYGATWTTGDIISIAVDRTADTLQFYKNGSGQGTIDISSLDEEFFCYMGYTGGSGPCSTILNFGQDGTFAGNVTAGGNSDGTGYGNFKYSVPSGFLALCSGNQPVAEKVDPAETDDDYPQKLFSPILYTGNDTTNNITGLGFQPDLMLFKIRNTASSGMWVDSSRARTKALYSINNNAEVTIANITAIGTDGFSLDGTSDYKANFNGNSNTYVTWCWRANGGTTSTNESGTIDSTVQVDPSECFSIITYTGDNTNSVFTVGHGLSAKPTFIIAKDRDQARNFSVWSQHLNGGSPADGDTLYLNTSAAETDQGGSWDVSNITSTLIGGVDGGFLNTGTNKQMFYAFTDCEGYIKSGTYEGVGNTDGAFVYTGFRPSFVMTKMIDGSAEWTIFDDARDTYNLSERILQVDIHDAERTDLDEIDILSNGFKCRYNGGRTNQSSKNYIYLAMARNPFKYATAR